MYYNDSLAKLSDHDVIKDDLMLALRIELFYGIQVYSVSEDAQKAINYFEKTVFQRRMCDAEAITIATQFWAKIAEFNGTDVDNLSVDTKTGATPTLEW